LRTEATAAGLRRAFATLALVGSLFGLAPGAAATGAVPSPPTESPNAVREIRVLLMYAEDRLSPAFVAQDEAFRGTLQSSWPGPVAFNTEYLEFLRRPGEVEEKLMLELLERKYQSRRPDLVVTSTSVGLEFLLTHRARLFTGIPIIFMAVHPAPVARLTIPSDVTGTWLSVDWAGTLDVALRLQPRTRQVLVVGGASGRDAIWVASARTQLAPYQSKVAIQYLSHATLAQTLQTVASLPDDAIVLTSTFHRDSAGKDYASRDAVARIARESRVPVYGVLETLVGTGVVGGHVLSPALDGEKAARLALRVLAGDRAGPPVPGGTVPIFDWWQLQRWGLDERQLPAGSVLRFRQPSLWEAYRWHVVAVVLIVRACRRSSRRSAPATSWRTPCASPRSGGWWPRSLTRSASP